MSMQAIAQGVSSALAGGMSFDLEGAETTLTFAETAFALPGGEDGEMSFSPGFERDSGDDGEVDIGDISRRLELESLRYSRYLDTEG